MRHAIRIGPAIAGAALALVFCTQPLQSKGPPAQRRPQRVGANVLMRVKLTSSQKILEGLTKKNFQLIQDGAADLQEVGEAADWKKSNDAVYLHYSREFHRLAQKLERLAEDRNLEGASFTYMHTIHMCLSCHEHVRDVLRIADGPKETPIPLR